MGAISRFRELVTAYFDIERGRDSHTFYLADGDSCLVEYTPNQDKGPEIKVVFRKSFGPREHEALKEDRYELWANHDVFHYTDIMKPEEEHELTDSGTWVSPEQKAKQEAARRAKLEREQREMGTAGVSVEEIEELLTIVGPYLRGEA